MMADAPIQTESQRFRVLDLEVDLDQMSARRDGQELELPELSFRLLAALVRQAPERVTKDELIREVWDGVIVGDETLAQRVSLLRQALGDNSQNPRYIASVRGRGYRLICTVEKLNETLGSHRRGRLWPAIASVSVLTVFLLVFFLSNEDSDDVPDNKPVDNRIASWAVAVLPFKDISPNSDQAYFSDGMHEEIISRLSGIPGLAVTSRTSVLPYREVNKNISKIAAELDVNLIVEGSVRYSDEQIRITIQLIDAVADEHLWVATYDRPLRIGEIFDIQSDVGEKVAAALRIELDADSSAEEKLPVDSLVAYNNYLLGRYHLRRGNSLDLKRSIGFFERAIVDAPDFAAAHAGLGHALAFIGTNYGWLPPVEAFTRAEHEVEEALRLDPDSVEAYSLRGDILTWYGWNWVEAEKAYKKAIEEGARFDLGYALLLSVLGRHDEAIIMIEETIEAFPRDRWVRSNAAWRFLGAGKLERAILEADIAIAIDDSYGDAYASRGRAFLSLDNFERALQDLEKNVQVNNRSVSTLCDLAIANYRAGNEEIALQLLDEVLKTAVSAYSAYADVARVYVTLGDFESTLEWLDLGYKARSRSMIFLRGSAWDPIRDDIRFQELMRRLAL